MAKGRDASHKSPNVLDIPDQVYFINGKDLVGVHFNVTLGDDVPRSLPWGVPKVRFSGFSLMWKQLRLAKVSSRSGMRLLPY
jgi:hypothetical protein